MENKRNKLIKDADMKRQFLLIITVALVQVFIFLNHAAAAPVADFTADVTAGLQDASRRRQNGVKQDYYV